MDVQDEQDVGDTVTVGKRSSWRFGWLAVAVIGGFLAQSIFFTSLCGGADIKGRFFLTVDLLWVVRVVGAYVVRERNKGWVFYLGLMVGSPGWMWVVFDVVTRMHQRG